MPFTVTRQRAQEVHDLARARAGLPYAYGGAFTLDPRRSTDCSGLVLQTAAWYGGRTDWPGNRYGSTESFRLNHKIVFDLGFKRLPPGGPAALPFKPVMLVGLQHGGGGEFSHTACTLMTMDIPGGPVKMSDRGVDWESRGGNPGVFLYDGARAWNDPLFHDFWYLDAKLEDAPVSTLPDVADVLSRAMGGRLSLDRYRRLLPAVSASLTACECTTVNRIAMWCAQIGHESGGLYYTEEIASGAAYEGRTDLGNTQPGDGVRFKGRSWIQITGRSNYTQLSKWANSKGLVPSATYFVDNPAALASDDYAGLGAAWYWVVARPDINALADRRDLDAVTRRINGGTNGIGDRLDRYNRALSLGEQLLTLIGGDDLSAEAERMIRELWEFYVDRKYPSQSIYATPGEGPRWKIWEQIRNIDGMEHPRYVEDAARLGDFRELARIALVAGGAATDPVAARARQFMTELERDNPDMLKAFIAANGVETR